MKKIYLIVVFFILIYNNLSFADFTDEQIENGNPCTNLQKECTDFIKVMNLNNVYSEAEKEKKIERACQPLNDCIQRLTDYAIKQRTIQNAAKNIKKELPNATGC